MALAGAHRTLPQSQTSTFEGNPSPHLVGGSPGTMNMKGSMIALVLNPHLQSRRRLPELLPGRRRERGPCRNLEHAARPRSN